VPEYEIDGGRYRLDFAWPEVKVAVEVDGGEFHADHTTWQRGMARDRWLLGNGWAIPHYTWEFVRDHPETVADEVRHLIASRARHPSEL
jgi:very-short-patch-repair endonuclease